MLKLACLTLAATALLVVLREEKPNLTGVWEVDKTHSDFGRMPAPESLTDRIVHREPRLVISSVLKLSPRRALVSTIRAMSDGSETVNVINGREFRARCHWEGLRLVLEVRDSEGRRMTELRYLAADGRSLVVESYLGEPRGKPAERRVMVRRTAHTRGLPYAA